MAKLEEMKLDRSDWMIDFTEPQVIEKLEQIVDNFDPNQLKLINQLREMHEL